MHFSEKKKWKYLAIYDAISTIIVGKSLLKTLKYIYL